MAVKKEELSFDESTKVNSKGQVILGRLSGPCADFVHSTRNGRKYSESLWEKVFNSPIINEYFECGGIPGELDHPTDRLETCSEKIAIMMPEKPKKGPNGQLIATFDILDTPNGRIAATLAKYGYALGISSRGNGEVYEDIDGNEIVDEGSYDFKAFDLVLLPAVKSARLKMVESLDTNKKNFKAAINEALENANDDEKRVMQETLANLNIEYNHENVIDKSSDFAAKDVGADVVKDLQESLLVRQKLEATITELQEKLSVCYAKEAKLEEDVEKYKSAVRNLTSSASSAKALQGKVDSLTNDLATKDKLLESVRQKYEEALSKQSIEMKKQTTLSESLSKKDIELAKARADVKRLNEDLENFKQNDYKNLQENLADAKKNLTIKTNEYTVKLANANKLVEQYRATAKTAVNKYIASQADKLGVRIEEIQNKLPKNYSFADIDSICEGLKDFKVKVSNLPFNLQKDTKVVVKESKQTIVPKSRLDDTVDASLLRMANIQQ